MKKRTRRVTLENTTLAWALIKLDDGTRKLGAFPFSTRLITPEKVDEHENRLI